MDIIIPKSLTQYELYSLAQRVIKDYELDEVNLYEFPIRVFNKLAYSLSIPVDQRFNERLSRVFSEKGSYTSVVSLLKVLDIDSTLSVDQTPVKLSINVDMSMVSNMDFLQYLSDAISYLIFFDELTIAIELLIFKVGINTFGKLNLVSANVFFDNPDLEERYLKTEVRVKDPVDISAIGVDIVFTDYEKIEKLIQELRLTPEPDPFLMHGLDVKFGETEILNEQPEFGVQLFPIPDPFKMFGLDLKFDSLPEGRDFPFDYQLNLKDNPQDSIKLYGIDSIFSQVDQYPDKVTQKVLVQENIDTSHILIGMDVLFSEVILNN